MSVYFTELSLRCGLANGDLRNPVERAAKLGEWARANILVSKYTSLGLYFAQDDIRRTIETIRQLGEAAEADMIEGELERALEFAANEQLEESDN